jgi:hypothetical protein
MDVSLFGSTAINIDALHILRGGGLVLSVNIGNGTLGGVAVKSSDLVRHDPVGGTTRVHLNGEGLFDGDTANLNATTAHPSSVPILGPFALDVLLVSLAGGGVWVSSTRSQERAITG